MKLELSNINFYSTLDEESFVFYLKNITPKIERIGSKIIVHIEKKIYKKEKLRNIFGLIERYNIKVENIEELISEKYTDYIFNPKMFWYKYFDNWGIFFQQVKLAEKIDWTSELGRRSGCIKNVFN